MMDPEDLDRLLNDCARINHRLSPGERRALARFLRLRERHGRRTLGRLAPDDVELLEDWAETAREMPDDPEFEPVPGPAETPPTPAGVNPAPLRQPRSGVHVQGRGKHAGGDDLLQPRLPPPRSRSHHGKQPHRNAQVHQGGKA